MIHIRGIDEAAGRGLFKRVDSVETDISAYEMPTVREVRKSGLMRLDEDQPANESAGALFSEVDGVSPDLSAYEPPTPGEQARLAGMCRQAGFMARPRKDGHNGHSYTTCHLCGRSPDVPSTDELQKWWSDAGLVVNIPLRTMTILGRHNLGIRNIMCPTNMFLKAATFGDIRVYLAVSRLADDWWQVRLSTWFQERTFRCDGMAGVQAVLSGPVAELTSKMEDYAVRLDRLKDEMRELELEKSQLMEIGKAQRGV